ncbi:MAG: glycolate oxidase subunit GlcF [Sphingomonadales bacterium]
MQTNFTRDQLADPEIARADRILRTCVHCGFCTATCPTYVLTGNELESPRGRIYLIKSLLEKDQKVGGAVIGHLDSCLSCLVCMTTCPADVDYMHLVDLARRRVEQGSSRPLATRLPHAALGAILTTPALLRSGLRIARILGRFARWAPGRLRAAVELARRQPMAAASKSGTGIFPAQGKRRKRVILLAGCVQDIVARPINDATIRLLTRMGCEVVVPAQAGCCGGLARQLGQSRRESRQIKRNLKAWTTAMEAGGIDAVVVNASGCGTVVKDYGHAMRGVARWRGRAEWISALTVDICEFAATLGLEGFEKVDRLTVACHVPCSLEHGQRVVAEPAALLQRAGFDVRRPPRGQLCCGGAGSYALLQSRTSAKLRERAVANILTVAPDVIATGNIGCLIQLSGGAGVPVVHTVELLDWATGGPRPAALQGSLISAVG